MITVVFNLATQQEVTYVDIPASQAVLCAYAQHQRHPDWSTWSYKDCYGSLVEFAGSCVTCGDWTAFIK